MLDSYRVVQMMPPADNWFVSWYIEGSLEKMEPVLGWLMCDTTKGIKFLGLVNIPDGSGIGIAENFQGFAGYFCPSGERDGMNGKPVGAHSLAKEISNDDAMKKAVATASRKAGLTNA